MTRITQKALTALGYNPNPARLESWAVLIHEAMVGVARQFHTPEHVFSTARTVGPIETLAVLFHDVVYVQIDGGVTQSIERTVSRYVTEANGEYTIKAVDLEENRLAKIVFEVSKRVEAPLICLQKGSLR
jgi:hypothetical protein